MVTKKAARRKIESLVEQFTSELPQIKVGHKINEAQIEEKYIKPLFRSLNWNTDNSGLPLHREEFVVQATQVVGDSNERPDYLLQLPDPKKPNVMQKHLFIEAKHPKYDLRTDLRWIRQAYRYAYSTLSSSDKPENQVRLALLTDFEEFRLFDCAADRPLKSNVLADYNRQVVSDFDWTGAHHLIENFDRLWTTFERDSVANGSLLSLELTPIEQLENRVAPDDDFLSDLEKFRLTIAGSIARHDRTLSDREITAASQLLLDRIVFTRMLFDRGLERDHLTKLLDDSTSMSDADHSIYDQATKLFEGTLDKLYNGALFRSRNELSGLQIDNGSMRIILESLRSDKSPYTLGAMPVEIIGFAYEKFLGKVITRSGRSGRVTADYKPEVRKRGGVYYTPRHIVEEIVTRTLDPLLESCTTPEEALKLRIVDPSCGSGSFLIVAYERLGLDPIPWTPS